MSESDAQSGTEQQPAPEQQVTVEDQGLKPELSGLGTVALERSEDGTEGLGQQPEQAQASEEENIRGRAAAHAGDYHDNDQAEGRYDRTKAETVGLAVDADIKTPTALPRNSAASSLESLARTQRDVKALDEGREDDVAGPSRSTGDIIGAKRRVGDAEEKVLAVEGQIAGLNEAMNRDVIRAEIQKAQPGISGESLESLIDQRHDELVLQQSELEGLLEAEKAAVATSEAHLDRNYRFRRQEFGKRLEIQDREVERSLNAISDPYAAVYDMNPEHFANLPTSEFMEITKEYAALLYEQQLAAEAIEAFEERQTIGYISETDAA